MFTYFITIQKIYISHKKGFHDNIILHQYYECLPRVCTIKELHLHARNEVADA